MTNDKTYTRPGKMAGSLGKFGAQLVVGLALWAGLTGVTCFAQTDGLTAGHQPDDQPSANRSPLSVRDGVLLKDGTPYRAIGMVYYDAFNRFLMKGDTSYRLGFQQLEAAGIPFIRFQVLPYWPSDAQPFVDNPQALFTALDTFVADAAKYHIGLVPVVFFNWSTVPDIEVEPVSAWGNFTSKTRVFAASFAQQLAARYANNPTIWMWEMTNEINDWADFPNAYEFHPWPINPSKGTPTTRGPADDYTSAQMLSAFSGFVAAVHAGDPTRLVDSGYDVPRTSAFNFANHGFNGPYFDTVAQFDAVVADQYTPGDVVSMHVYPNPFLNTSLKRFKDEPVDVEQFLPYAQQASEAIRQPLYIGEYGVPDDGSAPYNTPQLSYAEFQNLTNAIVTTLRSGTCSGLATVWVFDFAYQSTWDITATNAHADRLRLVSQMDELLRRPGCEKEGNEE